MKKKSLVFLALIFFSFGVIAQNVNIPDPMFKNYLINNKAINTNEDNEIQLSEAIAFTGTIECNKTDITDLTGIEAFTALTVLWCNENELTTLDLSQNKALTHVYCWKNKIKVLNLPQDSSLELVNCMDNDLDDLNLAQSTVLLGVECSNNNLTTLDVSKNPALNRLGFSDNQITEIDVTQNPDLTHLHCARNQITAIDVTQNPAMLNIDITANEIMDIDTTKNLILRNLVITSSAFTAIDVSHLPDLVTLSCANNHITELDLSQNKILLSLLCNDNILTSLNLANGNSYIYSFDARNNPDLTCIQVDDVAYYTNNWSRVKDSTAAFSTDCEDVMGMEDLTDTSGLFMYPNPASSQINIETKDQIETITIYNLTGALVKTITTQTFSVSDLADGTYILKINTNTGTVNRRLVKVNN